MSTPASARLWYVISDIHGNYEAFRNLLLHTRLIDANNRWIGGEAQLFLLGDYVTTAPQSREVISLIRSLERQAPGRVISLFGNHELFLLRAIYDSRYRQKWLTNPEHWQTIASWAVANEPLEALLTRLCIQPLSTPTIRQIYQASVHTESESDARIKQSTQSWAIHSPICSADVRQAWRVFCRAIEEDGTLEWIRQRPAAHKQDEWGFFHAGPPTGFDGDMDDLNHRFNKLLLDRRFEHPLLAPDRAQTSPIGTRRWWVEASRVDSLFHQFTIERCAFGHDPKAIRPRGVLGQVWNKAVSTDPYMRAGIEGAIRICGNCVDALYTDVAASRLQRIYPQQTFLCEARLIG